MIPPLYLDRSLGLSGDHFLLNESEGDVQVSFGIGTDPAPESFVDEKEAHSRAAVIDLVGQQLRKAPP
jgi:hypothetical protein